MNYETIKDACKKSSSGEISLSNILSERFYHKEKGWTKLRVSYIDLDGLLDVLGGRKREVLRKRVLTCDNNTMFNRLKYTIDHGWVYCPGQDYPAELAMIRKLIIKGE